MDETEGDNLANVSEPIKDLIRALLVTNPGERLTLIQLKAYLVEMQQLEPSAVSIRLCQEASQKKE